MSDESQVTSRPSRCFGSHRLPESIAGQLGALKKLQKRLESKPADVIGGLVNVARIKSRTTTSEEMERRRSRIPVG
ncbi:hypothetical protein DY000_02021912 [Brassica cretica]|uniref:Uncharacterized protein n=1 Tax=Brassica cretica TaxID=69181 RepID=A0ABQ7EFT2_BRACR|nr:hypothetical protein DY000_02021912 [Brassica cretica]